MYVPPLLRAFATDEFSPLPRTARDEAAIAEAAHVCDLVARRDRVPLDVHGTTRRATAATLRAIDRANGGGFYEVDAVATADEDAAAAGFAGGAPVVDVQTHLVDARRWQPAGGALDGFLRMVDPDRWPGPVDPRLIDGAAWAAHVFGTSETAVALLTSTPGPATDNVLTNGQIAAARDVVERYAGTRVLTHAIVHPNLGPRELDAMADWSASLRPSGWKCYTLYGPATAASPTGGWFLDDEEIGFAFLERVMQVGPRIVAVHKGLSGPIPDAALPAASPRDIGPAARAFPEITFVVYHSGYERDPDGEEGPFDPAAPRGVDQLVASLAAAGIGPSGNVYAELGSTWFLMLRRPLEAAHVIGKLLAALGPDRVLWGTDSVWYGSPQPLIDAFRAFRIPEWMQERFGYPALTAGVKDRILSHSARRAYCIDDAVVDAAAACAPGWVPDGAAELLRAVEREG